MDFIVEKPRCFGLSMGNQGFGLGKFELEFLLQEGSQAVLDCLRFLLWANNYVSSKVNPFDPLFDAPFRAFTMAVRETHRHPGPRFCEPGARAMPPLTWVGERCAPRATGVLH